MIAFFCLLLLFSLVAAKAKYKEVSTDAILKHLENSGISIEEVIKARDNPPDAMDHFSSGIKKVAESAHPWMYTAVWGVLFVFFAFLLWKRVRLALTPQKQVFARKKE